MSTATIKPETDISSDFRKADINESTLESFRTACKNDSIPYPHKENLLLFFEKKGIYFNSPYVLPTKELLQSEKILDDFMRIFPQNECHVNSLGFFLYNNHVAEYYDFCYGFADGYTVSYQGNHYQSTVQHSFLVHKKEGQYFKIIDIALNIVNLNKTGFEKDYLHAYKNYFGIRFTKEDILRNLPIETVEDFKFNISEFLKENIFPDKEKTLSLIQKLS